MHYRNYSNPKALAVEGGTIFIGLNGHSEILRYNSSGVWAYPLLHFIFFIATIIIIIIDCYDTLMGE